MSELQQTKLAVIVMAVITVILLLLMNMGSLANSQWLIFILFCVALGMTILLALKFCAEWLKERAGW